MYSGLCNVIEWTLGTHEILIDLHFVPRIPKTSINHSRPWCTEQSWCSLETCTFGLCVCVCVCVCMSDKCWTRCYFELRPPLQTCLHVLGPHIQTHKSRFLSLKERIWGRGWVGVRWGPKECWVGPRIFFSGSSALLLQLRDAFECQQLAEAQNASEKTKIKRDRRKRGGIAFNLTTIYF